jgi:hypothetical protein
MRLRRIAVAGVVAGASLAVLAGCTSDGGSDVRDDAAPDEGSLPFAAPETVPPERLTPFCQGMIELADRLEADPPADSTAVIVDAYTELLPVVPPEIDADFRAVLQVLRGDAAPEPSAAPDAPTTPTGTAPSTDVTGSVVVDADPLPDEGFVPDDDPAGRISAYVDFVCRDASNNPGPPPTQPLDDVAPDESSDEG